MNHFETVVLYCSVSLPMTRGCRKKDKNAATGCFNTSTGKSRWTSRPKASIGLCLYGVCVRDRTARVTGWQRDHERAKQRRNGGEW
jgi:hypothetical protein